MNYLVTGASGFIGSAFIRYIVDNDLLGGDDNIYLLTKKAVKINDDRLHYIYLRNYEFKSDYDVPEIDIAFLIGSYIPKSRSELNNPEKCLTILTSIQNLLSTFANKIGKVIYLSTVDVYTNTNLFINEDTSTIPSTLYGASKLLTESWINDWAKKNKKDIQILRIGHIYGCGEEKYKKLIPETIKKVIKGVSPVLYSNVKELRSYLNISDLVRFLWKVAQLKGVHGVTNLASSRHATIEYIIQTICNISSNKLDVKLELDISFKEKNLKFDTSKMENLIGKEYYTLEEGLKEEYDHIKMLLNE